jgi:hypothetical protein
MEAHQTSYQLPHMGAREQDVPATVTMGQYTSGNGCSRVAMSGDRHGWPLDPRTEGRDIASTEPTNRCGPQ